MSAMGMNGSRNNDEGGEAAPQQQQGGHADQGGFQQQQNPCAQQMDEFLQVRNATLRWIACSVVVAGQLTPNVPSQN